MTSQTLPGLSLQLKKDIDESKNESIKKIDEKINELRKEMKLEIKAKLESLIMDKLKFK